jgi:zinc transporter ZupT
MTVKRPAEQIPEAQIDRFFVERERNRAAGRAVSFIILLNGAAALTLLVILAQAPASTVDSKIAGAMMFFSGGAVAALFASFLAYINRTVRIESPQRANLRRILRILASVAVIGSAAAFLTGMNMVATASSEKSSSHPKSQKEQLQNQKTAPSERVDLMEKVRTIGL